MTDFDSLRARRARALRAAQVVTLSTSLTSLAACGGGTDTPDAFTPPTPDAFAEVDAFAFTEAGTADVLMAMDAPSTGEDAPVVGEDAPSTGEDAPVVADDAYTFMGDGGCGPDFPPTNQECCVLAGGFWDGESSFCAIAVPGPFVPPTMDA